MNKAEKDLIDEKFKGILLHQSSNYDLINQKLEQIHVQTKKTNSRVDKCEDKVNILFTQTRIARFFESKPIFLVLIILGLFTLLALFDLQDIIKLIK